jgi:hypothetical protein
MKSLSCHADDMSHVHLPVTIQIVLPQALIMFKLICWQGARPADAAPKEQAQGAPLAAGRRTT